LAFQQEQLNHQERKLEWIGSKIVEIELRQCKLSIMEYDVVRFMHTELSHWRIAHDETYIKRKFDEYAHMLYVSRLSQGLGWSEELLVLLKLQILYKQLQTQNIDDDKLLALDRQSFWPAGVSSRVGRSELNNAIEQSMQRLQLQRVSYGALEYKPAYRPAMR
jgi:hypothetical protein